MTTTSEDATYPLVEPYVTGDVDDPTTYIHIDWERADGATLRVETAIRLRDRLTTAIEAATKRTP